RLTHPTPAPAAPHPAERAGASAHSKWRDMITFTHRVAGEECKINFPERRADISEFQDFLSRGDKVIGVDSETSGLDVFSPGFELRLVQFGNRDEAWVLRADLFAEDPRLVPEEDRKSTRLNSSHVKISYAVFCLKKKKKMLRHGKP